MRDTFFLFLRRIRAISALPLHISHSRFLPPSLDGLPTSESPQSPFFPVLDKLYSSLPFEAVNRPTFFS